MTENLPAMTDEDLRPPKLPDFHAGAAPQALIPSTFEQTWRTAVVLFKSGMQPEALDSPEKIMVVLMHGLEVGLSPMQAVQSIALINQRPTVWGDAALGLVYASGLLEDFEEQWIEKDGTVIAQCAVKRRGRRPIQGEFSLKDAATAGLLNKGVWKTYPYRMLKMRARAFALRDAFADVLKGLHIREEVMDYVEGTSPEITPSAPTIIRDATKQNGQKKDDGLEIPAELDRRKSQQRQAFAASPAEHAWIEKVAKGLAACEDHDSFNKFVTDVVNPGNAEFRAVVKSHIEERVSVAWKKLSGEILGKKDAGAMDTPGADAQTLGPDRA